MAWWGRPHRQAQYRESVFVGYRYYETAGMPVAYCFGHGLSYTQFSYSDLEVSGDTAAFTLGNTGPVVGTEVAQVYLAPVQGGVLRPALQLAGFARVQLEPGASQRVVVELDPKSRSVWQDGWRELAGEYRVLVGSSVRDIRLSYTFAYGGEKPQPRSELAGTWYEHLRGKPTAEDFEKLLGRPAPPEASHGPGEYDETDSLTDLAKTSRISALVASVARRIIESKYGDPDDPTCRMCVASSIDAAIFSLINSSGGSVPAWFASLLLRIANLRIFPRYTHGAR